MPTLEQQIIADRQIKKFCFYGFFKNLKFFEPYLYLYLLSLGFNLLDIGLLFAIRELITTLFEIPSGIFADHYGKKTELLFCFVFYMISFTFFFLTHHFAIAAVGMIFFGLGEAFRSGTHKAMIYSYLERKGWFEHKTMVYGRTRSYSLLGSAVSALLAIVFVLAIPAVRWIFLITIVPYLFDFALILSYPDYLNEARQSRFSWRHFVQASRTQIKEIAGNGYLQKVLLSSALFDGTFKCIKDYIQPILKVLLLGSAIWTISGSTSENQLKIMLGIVYGIFYLVSSQASRHVHRIHQWFSSRRAMNISFDVFALILLVLSVCVQMQWISWVLLFFFALYLMKDARRPLFVDICGESMSKHQRATVLSVESQLRAVFMTALAPIFGWVAEELSVAIALAGTGFLLLAVNRLIHIPRQEAVN